TRWPSSSSSRPSSRSWRTGPRASASKTRTWPSCAPSATPSTTSSSGWASGAEGTSLADSTLDRLEDMLGRPFEDRQLLARALAHRSFCAENPAYESNERLEFLGDAVLGLVVTDYIYRAFPHLPEGELAKVRASVVAAGVLDELANEIELGSFVLLGKGEGLSGGREKPSILADALEPVLASTYLDGGWDAAYELVMSPLGERIAAAAEGPGGQDYKTRLQELAARRFDQMPRYEVRDE